MTRVCSIDIDSKAGSAYLYFEPASAGISSKQVNIGDSIVMDFGVDGRLVGIEILDPRLAAQFASEEASRALAESHVPVRLTA